MENTFVTVNEVKAIDGLINAGYILAAVLIFLVTPVFFFNYYTDQVWEFVTSDGRVYIQAPPKDKHQKDYDYFTKSNPEFKVLEKKVKVIKDKGYTYSPPKEFIRN